jgi:hypothetical protein
VLKASAIGADTPRVNTFAASTSRVPRAAFVGIAVLIAALAALMLVRTGVIGDSSDALVLPSPPSPTRAVTKDPTAAPAAKPRIVLLPNLPAPVAHRLRYSKVVVVALYATPADRAKAARLRAGARRAGAGFTALSLTNEADARAVAVFAGQVSPPTLLIVKRPGKIVNRLPGVVDGPIVAQAAHNAGARR